MSEIVAKWIASTGIDPANLVDPTDVEFDQTQLTNDSPKVTSASDEAINTDVPQNDPEQAPPTPVEIGTELKNDATASACILGKVFCCFTCLYRFSTYIVFKTFRTTHIVETPLSV